MAWNKDAARTFVFNYLRGKLKAPSIINVNRFGHTLLKADTDFFYYLFKKDRIHSFNYIFKEYVAKPNAITGLGESINKEYLIYALNHKATLLFCYEDLGNAIYTPSRAKLLTLLSTLFPEGIFNNLPTVALLKVFCEYHNLIRQQDRTNTYKTNDYTDAVVQVNEVTYCFPYAIVERFKV